MKKKISIISILFISLFLITGCGTGIKEKEEIVSRDFITNNKGIFCEEYGVATIDTTREDGGIIVVYKAKGYNYYTKLFETNLGGGYYHGSTIMTTEDNIYFIRKSPAYITAYPLNNNKDDVKSFEVTTNFIAYNIKEIFGLRDDNIYISYINWENRWSNPEIVEYAKISFDLKNFEVINKEDIPTIYYTGCN